MQFAIVLQLFIVCLAIHQLLNEQLPELPAILDSFITGYANTTITPILLVEGQSNSPCKVKTA